MLGSNKGYQQRRPGKRRMSKKPIVEALYLAGCCKFSKKGR
jgi:hypothetical protein